MRTLLMRRTILLIEADPGLRRRFKTFLEWENFHVSVAEDESAAIREIQHSPLQFQLVITSIKDSDTGKQSLIAELSKAKFLFLADPQSKPLAFKCENCVPKPDVPEALVSHVLRVFLNEERRELYLSA
jgi:CheY-like chemotaxis protein